MSEITLQRTLLIGLGDVAGQTVAAFLAELEARLGQLDVLRAVVVTDPAVELAGGEAVVRLSPGENGTLPAALEAAVIALLTDISHLQHLTRLNRQGISLRTDELVVMVVADLAETWVSAALAAFCQNVGAMVNPALAPHLATVGLLLWSTEMPPPDSEAANQLRADWAALAAHFDQGCYVAGLTNEDGLIVGDPRLFVTQMATFLALPICLARQDGGWPNPPNGRRMPVTHVGLAQRCWPAAALVAKLIRRWSRTMLADLLNQPPARGPTDDPAESAQRQAQQTLLELKLTPPQLLETLAEAMPAVPRRLDELIPETPWPWLLQTAFEALEQITPPWQEAWLKNGRRLDAALAALRADWPDEAPSYLGYGLHHHQAGAVLLVQARIAAMTELLAAFAEGVEARLDEAETELAQIDQRLGQSGERLAGQLDALPSQPVALALGWGLRPWRWPALYRACRLAQNDLRQVAHLQQARLQSWQQLSLLEALLPLYRDLVEQWPHLTRPWIERCRQVGQAVTMLAPEAADEVTIPEPWSATAVEKQQQTLEAETTAAVWIEAGSLAAWVSEAAGVEAILDRLRQPMLRRLAELWQRPADVLLAEQLPQAEAQLAFLQQLSEEATPFWPFDEAALAEPDRVQVKSQRVLLLPQGTRSPLGSAARQIKPVPALWPSLTPEQIAVVTLRHVPVGET
ncbi:MAG: hypothetical protein KDJ65_34930 [Anaerolineae bacterium]|nr:hypothetical protein [Anaerolineae bacterium]